MTQLPDIAWCEVPAGKFIMGSDDGRDNEKPQHTLNLPYTYYAAKYPVTNAQYATFVADGGYDKPQYWTAAGWKWRKQNNRTEPYSFSEPFNLSNHPLIGVSWYESVAYCYWLTELMQENCKLTEGWLIRLPTEAEWEKAARGTDGWLYPWGNEADLNKANYWDTEVKSTSAVGFFGQGKSKYGCQDMAGNVWEWGATQYCKSYPYQIENEWTEAYLAGEISRTIRGGSWDNRLDCSRCTYRSGLNPHLIDNHRGFRLFRCPIF